MSAQVQFKAIFDEQFNLLLSKGLNKAEAAAKALLNTNEIVKQKASSHCDAGIGGKDGAMLLAVGNKSSSSAYSDSPSTVSDSKMDSCRKKVETIEFDMVKQLIDSSTHSDDITSLIKLVSDSFCSPSVLLESFVGAPVDEPCINATALPFRLDIHGIQNTFNALSAMKDSRVDSTLSFALENLSNTLTMANTSLASVKPYIFLLEYEGLIDPSKESIIRNLLKGYFKIPSNLKFQMFRWIYEHAGLERVARYLSVFRQFMTIRVFSGDIEDARLATKFIGVLYDARAFNPSYQSIPLSDFYSDPINEEYMQSRDGRRIDFTMWSKEQFFEYSGSSSRNLTKSAVEDIIRASTPIKQCYTLANNAATDSDSMVVDSAYVTTLTTSPSAPSAASTSATQSDEENSIFTAARNRQSNLQSFCRMYTLSEKRSFISHPYVLTPATKALVLEFDAAVQMRKVMDVEVQTAIATGQTYVVPYFVLRVRREHIVMDTLGQVMLFEDTEFKKPLKVIFDDEDGVDAGGVRKEFYQVMTKQLFNPGYGMFKSYDETRLLWFNSDSLESSQEFELVGLLLGVAIYNSIIIDLKLPLTVYKKLKHSDYRSTLADLAVLQPSLAHGLQSLLDFDGDVAAVFGSTFSITYEVRRLF
jgi:hypothetical protein